MKTKSTKSKSTSNANETTAQKPVALTKTIYVRDDEQTHVGFRTHDEAVEVADRILPRGPNGSRDSDRIRVRVSYRRRTGLYDVVVKVARQVPIVTTQE